MEKLFQIIKFGILLSAACTTEHALCAQEGNASAPLPCAARMRTPPPSEFCPRVLKFAAENAIAPQLQMQFCLAAAMLGFPNFDGAAQNSPVRITFEKERAFAEVLAEKDSEFQNRLAQFAAPTFGNGNGKYRIVAIPLKGASVPAQCLRPLPQLSAEEISAMPLIDAVIAPETLAEFLDAHTMGFLAHSAEKSLKNTRAKLRLLRKSAEITARADFANGAELLAKTPSKDLAELLPETPQKAVSTFRLAKPAQIDFSKAGAKLPKVSATGAFVLARVGAVEDGFAAVFEVAPDGGDFRGETRGAYFAKKSSLLAVATEEQTLENILRKIDSARLPTPSGQKLTLKISAAAATATLEIAPVIGASGRVEALEAKAEIPAALLKAAVEKFAQNGGTNGKN